jgi:thiosulfate/3-mercaptopyruvate sulfurtransferase
MQPLLAAERLIERLNDPGLRVLDARFELVEPPAGRRAYREGHVPGAVFVDLDEDLAAPPGRHGGRHPLPDMQRFARRLADRGVGDGHDVVVYDQGATFYAARAWWMLRYIGHDRVWVLDGGLPAYLEAGGRLTREEPCHEAAPLSVRLRPEMVVGVHYVRAHLHAPDVLLLDARAPERYRGEVEPLDPKAGHVPSAVNRPYEHTFDGPRLRDTAALRRLFTVAVGRETVVHYCGSGVSAAHNILAMEAAGLPGSRLYAGSWSDWCSHETLPVATGDEEP